MAASQASSAGDSIPFGTLLHMINPKLSSSNYLLWRNNILNLLSYQELVGYVDGSVEQPEPTLTDEKGTSMPNPALVTWKANTQKVAIILQASLEQEAMAEALGHKTPRDIWVALEAAYSHDSDERVQSLKDSLRFLKKGSSSVAEFGRQFKAICDQLAAIDHPVAETDKSHWFLCGLGSSFETFSIAQMAIRPRPGFHALLSQAESHELFIKSIRNDSPVPTAAFYSSTQGRNYSGGNSSNSQSRGNTYGNNSGRNNGGNYGGNANRSNDGNGRDKTKRPPRCHLCRVYGHYGDKCPDFEKIARARLGLNTQNTANLAQAFQAGCSLNPDASDWFVDSGASAHMTPSTSNLDSATPYSGSEQVTIGNESSNRGNDSSRAT